MDEETRTIKKIIVEAPAELHSKFKMAVYGEGQTMKEAVLELIQLYIDDVEKNNKKGKK